MSLSSFLKKIAGEDSYKKQEEENSFPLTSLIFGEKVSKDDLRLMQRILIASALYCNESQFNSNLYQDTVKDISDCLRAVPLAVAVVSLLNVLQSCFLVLKDNMGRKRSDNKDVKRATD